MCKGVAYKHRGAIGAEAVRVTPGGVPKNYCNLTQVRNPELPQVTNDDMRRDQRGDPLGSLMIKSLWTKDPWILIDGPIEGANVIHREWERMNIEEGILY